MPARKEAESRPPSSELDDAKPLPLVVWAARLAVYFLAQGGTLLSSYAYYGFGTDPDSFPLGFRLDPLLAFVHLLWGVAGTYIGFFRPRYALAFVFAFAAFFTILVASLTLASPFGIEIDDRAKLFYWLVIAAAWIAALYGLRQVRLGRGAS
ncbi:MAG: hypothetical protein ACREDO_03790 [Methyloceanibacter sp.]